MYASHHDEDGNIRIRFENLSRRLNKINVDILHKEPESYHLQATLATPDAGALGCFTLDEFELLKTSDNSPAFKKLYREVINLIQSLPELLHHQTTVIQHLLTFFKTAPAKDLASGFSLLSVLGRDLDKELYAHFHDLFNVLVNILPKVAMSGGATPEEQTPNPELTAKLFESLSYLLRANLTHLIDSPHEISPYYGSLLSYPLHFVRDFAAKSLTIVIRKLSNKTFKDHFKKLIKATASNILQVVGKDSLSSFVKELYQQVESQQNEQSQLTADKADDVQKADNLKKSRNLLHGLSQMIFYTLKGITGQLHSKATQRLETLVKIVLSYAENGLTSKENTSEEIITNTISQVSIGGAIISSVIQELQEHLHSEYQKDLLLNVILLCSGDNSNQKTSPGSLVNALFLFKLRVLIQVITARKGKSVRSLETSVLNRFIEVCFEVILGAQHLHHELASASEDTIHLSRQLLVNLWTTFPTNKIILSQIKSLLEEQCLEIQPSQAILYFAQEWMTSLPRSITVEYLLPVFTSSIKKLQPVMSHCDWLAMVLNVITLIKDNRHDLVKFEDKVLPKEKLPIYEDDYVVGDDLIDCIEPVSTIFLEAMNLVKSDKNLSDDENRLLTLSAKILTWFSDRLDDHHSKLAMPHQVLVEAISNSLKKKAQTLTSLLSKPDLLLLLASGVDYIDDDVNAGRLLSELIKSLVDYILAQESFPTIGTTFALNALIEKFPDCVEEVPQFVLSSLLSAQTATAFVEKLSFALTTPSYWLKLEILRVLAHFQPPLDSNTKKNEDTPSEPMDVVRLCLECLCHPIDLQNEREIARRLEIVEVWCRGTKLSKDFMSIATGFCIGFLNVKFKPLWNTLIQVLVTISQTGQGEEILWNMLYQYFGPRAPITPAESMSSGRRFSVFSSASLLEGLESLQEYDNGDVGLPIELVQSSLFWWKVDEEIATSNTVLPDARADLDMVYSSIFQLLQKAPHITLKRSKLLVSAFLRFLRTQFYQAFPDEPEISSLSRYGVFLVDDEVEELNGTMSLKQVRSRLEAYLTAFGAVQSPRQLYKHQVLYIIYGELLCKPDNNLSKLALECILTYKQPEVVPYKVHLRKLYEDRTFREELIILSTPKPIEEEDENRIKEEHKVELFPIIIRILFGRLTARGGAKRADREQTSSRRVAVLAFIATLPTEFIGQLLYLMIRGITPIDDVNRDDPSIIVQFKQNIADIRVVTSELHDSYSKHVEEFMQIDSNTLSKVYWDKLIGFLFLLESVISNLALGLQDYVAVIHHVLEQTLIYAHSFKSASIQTQHKETEDDDDDDHHALQINEDVDTEMVNNDKQASIMNEGKYSANVRTMFRGHLYALLLILMID